MSEPGSSDPWREPYQPEAAAQPPAAPSPGAPPPPGAGAPPVPWPTVQNQPTAPWPTVQNAPPPAPWPTSPYPPAGYPAWGAQADPGGAWVMAQDAQSARTNALVALIVSCVCLSMMTVFAVPSAVLSGIALGKAATDPAAARRLTRWAWIALGICVGLGILFIVVIILTLFASGM